MRRRGPSGRDRARFRCVRPLPDDHPVVEDGGTDRQARCRAAALRRSRLPARSRRRRPRLPTTRWSSWRIIGPARGSMDVSAVFTQTRRADADGFGAARARRDGFARQRSRGRARRTGQREHDARLGRDGGARDDVDSARCCGSAPGSSWCSRCGRGGCRSSRWSSPDSRSPWPVPATFCPAAMACRTFREPRSRWCRSSCCWCRSRRSCSAALRSRPIVARPS